MEMMALNTGQTIAHLQVVSPWLSFPRISLRSPARSLFRFLLSSHTTGVLLSYSYRQHEVPDIISCYHRPRELLVGSGTGHRGTRSHFRIGSRLHRNRHICLLLN